MRSIKALRGYCPVLRVPKAAISGGGIERQFSWPARGEVRGTNRAVYLRTARRRHQLCDAGFDCSRHSEGNTIDEKEIQVTWRLLPRGHERI